LAISSRFLDVANAFEPVYVRRLCGPIPVIEIKYHSVWLAAIYAWMALTVSTLTRPARFVLKRKVGDWLN
jgi:hypothetical protein